MDACPCIIKRGNSVRTCLHNRAEDSPFCFVHRKHECFTRSGEKSNYSWNINITDIADVVSLMENGSLRKLLRSKYPKHMVDIRVVYNIKDDTQRLQIHLFGKRTIPKEEIDSIITASEDGG